MGLFEAFWSMFKAGGTVGMCAGAGEAESDDSLLLLL